MARHDLPPGGGALLLAWQLKDKRVLIVGGGDVASGRIRSVLDADAYITLIAPRTGLHPLTKFYIENSDRITYRDRAFSGPADLEGVDMVLSAIDDVDWSKRICDLCRERRIPVNVADIPPSCDFYFGAQIRKGPLQILISTNGNGPKLAGIIKSRIEDSLPENVDKAIGNVGVLRAKLKDRAPGVGGEVSKRRMQWMSSLCTEWKLDELAELDEATMEKLLTEGWEYNTLPIPNRTEHESKIFASASPLPRRPFVI
ncbi:siroheme synthase [Fomitiporia mediterranea MF3/22]|uniref:siroheme synthase n=1 Tax=Fomitiporia mediterranea (strain MF3/22) TaxID=694068 RepID=UPI0004407DD5|nr:siroheme synthase [Fomitiporia mediterranea MF3/22]EJD05713.1 siroheme synthase [Fomitiporia mediterranea MF3/22]